jgi:hypothetical protein
MHLNRTCHQHDLNQFFTKPINQSNYEKNHHAVISRYALPKHELYQRCCQQTSSCTTATTAGKLKTEATSSFAYGSDASWVTQMEARVKSFTTAAAHSRIYLPF